MSFVESWVNVLVGLAIDLGVQVVIFPWFGIDIPFTHNLGISACFTVVSVCRSYVIRRWFDRMPSERRSQAWRA